MVVMATRYIINLTEDERLWLEDLSTRKRVSKLKAQRAQILLKADERMTDAEVADELGVGTATVERIRKRAVLEGVSASRRRWTAGRKKAFHGSQSSMGGERRTWSRWRAASHPKGSRAGR